MPLCRSMIQPHFEHCTHFWSSFHSPPKKNKNLQSQKKVLKGLEQEREEKDCTVRISHWEMGNRLFNDTVVLKAISLFHIDISSIACLSHMSSDSSCMYSSVKLLTPVRFCWLSHKCIKKGFVNTHTEF